MPHLNNKIKKLENQRKRAHQKVDEIIDMLINDCKSTENETIDSFASFATIERILIEPTYKKIRDSIFDVNAKEEVVKKREYISLILKNKALRKSPDSDLLSELAQALEALNQGEIHKITKPVATKKQGHPYTKHYVIEFILFHVWAEWEICGNKKAALEKISKEVAIGENSIKTWDRKRRTKTSQKGYLPLFKYESVRQAARFYKSRDPIDIDKARATERFQKFIESKKDNYDILFGYEFIMTKYPTESLRKLLLKAGELRTKGDVSIKDDVFPIIR